VDGPLPENKLFGTGASTGDNFGDALALSADGTTAVIGAERHNRESASDVGLAYVFQLDGETGRVVAELRPDDTETGMDFGESVAVSGDGSTAVVGAGGTGTAYVFGRSSGEWSRQRTVGRGDEAGGLGRSVAIAADGSTVFVGGNSTAVRVFERTDDGWTRQTELRSENGSSDDWFGNELALGGDGSIALVAASEAPGPDGWRTGEVYVYTRTDGAWTRTETLQMEPAETQAHLGVSVALSDDGTTAVVGSGPKADKGVEVDPTAHVFERDADGWQRRERFVSDERNALAFANSVAVSTDGETVFVGGRLPDSTNGSPPVGPQVFHRRADGWSPGVPFKPDDDSKSFGLPVALSGDGGTALVGARTDDSDQCGETGAAYVFDVPPGP